MMKLMSNIIKSFSSRFEKCIKNERNRAHINLNNFHIINILFKDFSLIFITKYMLVDQKFTNNHLISKYIQYGIK